jgi:hypothetical protein
MPDKPTFGRYAEIPYEQMTLEQQEAYRSLIETRAATPLRETLRILPDLIHWLARRIARRRPGKGVLAFLRRDGATSRLRILNLPSPNPRIFPIGLQNGREADGKDAH